MLALVGASAVLLPAVASARPRAFASANTPTEPLASGVEGTALVAPLRAGARLGTWQINAISGVRHGAVTVELADASGALFCLDICARDDEAGAPEPPARSERYDIFLANEGQGADPTHEDHGLAAMALAGVVRANESTAHVEGLLTLRQRLDRYSSHILRRV